MKDQKRIDAEDAMIASMETILEFDEGFQKELREFRRKREELFAFGEGLLDNFPNSNVSVLLGDLIDNN